MIPYGRQSIDKRDIQSVVKVLKSDWITQGPTIQAFEKAVCDYTGAKYAVAVSNGTAALHIACLAAGIGRGDEVITSPITFVASANAVLYAQGKPVFADIDAQSINIDPKVIASRLNRKTKAIIPVHFAGYSCQMDKIKQLARQHQLMVIEDAAHALGSSYKGYPVGSCRYSDMTTFSFHPVKSITTGEGGMITTNNRTLYQRLLLLRNHGITRDADLFKAKSQGPWYYEMQALGFNYRLSDIHAALGLSQLAKLKKFVKRRQEIVNRYRQALALCPDVILPPEQADSQSAWHIFVIQLKNSQKRRVVVEQLREKGVAVQVHYIPVYQQPYYKQLGYESNCPIAERFYESAISLPIFPELTIGDQQHVIRTINNVLNNYKQ